jgi:iron complex transport system substrate-binding protein
MRVAALLPAATDIVIALGAGDQLVAVTHACRLPARLAGIPRVTRTRIDASVAGAIDAQVSDLSAAGAPLFEIDESLLIAQRPDVILTQSVCEVCAVREEDARAVASRIRPTPTLAALSASTVDGILDDIATVGAALDIDDADELLIGLRSRMRFIHHKLMSAQASRPRVLVLEWTNPAFNAGHWVPDMVRRAGGHEVLGQTGQVSKRVTKAEITGARPDVVIVAPCGYDLRDALREAEGFRSLDAWSWIGSTSVWALDANALTSSPGPGVVHGIEVLARVLHPVLFGAPSARDAVQLLR